MYTVPLHQTTKAIDLSEENCSFIGKLEREAIISMVEKWLLLAVLSRISS